LGSAPQPGSGAAAIPTRRPCGLNGVRGKKKQLKPIILGVDVVNEAVTRAFLLHKIVWK